MMQDRNAQKCFQVQLFEILSFVSSQNDFSKLNSISFSLYSYGLNFHFSVSTTAKSSSNRVYFREWISEEH